MNFKDHELIRLIAVAGLLNTTDEAVLGLGKAGELEVVEASGAQYVSVSSLSGYMKRKDRRAKKSSKGRANNEGSIYEAPKGSGIWYAAITIREGRKRQRVKRRTRSQKDALKLLEELKRQYLNPGAIELAPQPKLTPAPIVTYRELFVEWMAVVRVGLKRSTERHYNTAIDNWLNPHIGDKVVSSKDYVMLQDLFTNILLPSYAPTTLHQAANVLNQALEYAVDPQDYISKNPAAKLRLPKNKTVMPSIALALDELLAILRIAVRHPVGPIIIFGALTGARLSECIAIQKGDINPARDTIKIQRQLTPLTGVGLVSETPKTPGSERELPRTPRLAQFLERYMAERSFVLRHLGYKEEVGGWIFLNTEGRRVHPRLVEKAFDMIVEEAGLAATYPVAERSSAPSEGTEDKKPSSYKRKTCAVSFHDLRKTLLTHLGDLGVDETTRSKIAGHGPRNVTQRYDESTLKRMRAALVAFEELVFNGLDLDEGVAV